jgi:hypothetical protein
MSKVIFSICLILIASSLVSASKLEGSQNLRRLDLSSSWYSWTYKQMKLTYHNESNQYHVVTNLPNQASVNMMLSLYGTDNIISGVTTAGFTRYRPTATSTSITTVTAANPYFTASGTPYNLAIQVPCTDGTIMNVGASTFQTTTYGAGNNALVVSSLSTKNVQTLGDKSYGYLSMSVPSMTANQIGDTFSIYLDKIDRTGLVIFGKDLSYSRDILYTASWKTTNGSWSTQGTIQTKVGSADLGSNSYNLIFDINQNITGLPQTLFTSVLNSLSQYGVTGCSADIVQPTCAFSGRLWDLPTIYLKNVGGANTWFSQNIAIPPSVYVAARKQFGGIISQITLNFMALTTSSNSFNSFSLTSSYSSSSNPGYVTTPHVGDIIIDSSIMAHYYTLFEANSDGTGTISMYVASGTTSWWFYWRWPRWCKVIFIIVIVIIVLVVLLGGLYTAKRRRLQQQAAAN